MPLFEYTCQSCSGNFELLVRNAEKPRCPHCSSTRLQQHLSASAVHAGAATGSLPVCQSESAARCGPGFCRTGQCQFD